MKVLYFVEPWIERDSPAWKNIWFDILYRHAEILSSQQDVEQVFIVGDAQFDVSQKAKLLNSKVYTVEQKELKKIFSNSNDAVCSWYREDAPPEKLFAMMSLVKEKLCGFTPDLIWTFVTPVPYLRALFPDALILFQEIGAFCRPPYPWSWYLDGSGTFEKSLIGQEASKLLKMSCSEKGRKALNEFRKVFFDDKLISNNPFDRQGILGGRFKYLIFVPLQYNGHFVTDGLCNYKSQLDFLIEVLENAPQDAVVVPTEHVNPFGFNVLNEEVVKFLRKKYNNFYYDLSIAVTPMASQFLMAISDMVITISSTIGLQASFYGKKLISPSRSHVAAISDSSSLCDIAKTLNQPTHGIERTWGMFEFLFTNYFIPNDLLIQSQFLVSYLKKRISVAKEVELVNRYPQIGDIDFIVQCYLNAEHEKPFSFRKTDVQAAEVRVLEEKLANIKEELSLNHKEIDRLNGGIVHLELEVEKAKLETKKIEMLKVNVEKELGAVLNSTSWRFTAPLRIVMEFFKKHIRRISR